MSATDQNQKRHNHQYQDMLSRFDKILVIGLGQLGFPVAEKEGLTYMDMTVVLML
jgi:hypothetical protein